MPNWRELTGHQTFDDLWSTATARLQELGSKVVTNLNMGPFRLLLSLFLEAVSVLYDLLADVIAPSGFIEYATGTWLDLAAKSVGVIRREAVKAQGVITFGRSTAAGPVQLPAGTIVKTDPLGTGDPLLYITTVESILPDGSLEVSVPVTAEFAGSAYNVADGAVKNLVTHIPGIDSVTNRTGWLTLEGTDVESDDSLRERAKLAWNVRAGGGTEAAYRAWALEKPGVVEAVVVTGEPRGPGTLDVIITGTTGAPTSQLVSDVQGHVDTRKPLLDNVLIKGPTTKAVDISIQLLLPPVGGDPDGVSAEAERRIRALFQQDKTLKPAVTPLLPGQGLYRSQLIWLCQASPVEDVDVTTPAANEPPVPGQLLDLGVLNVTVVRRS